MRITKDYNEDHQGLFCLSSSVTDIFMSNALEVLVSNDTSIMSFKPLIQDLKAVSQVKFEEILRISQWICPICHSFDDRSQAGNTYSFPEAMTVSETK